MRLTRSIMLTILPPLLSACGQMPNAGVSESAKHGRYSGIGLYAPGKLWSEIAPADGEAKRDPALARRADDEQIIVVVDSRTGEVRECGNYSGYCVSIPPWARIVDGAPVKLNKHADEVEAAPTNNTANTVADVPAAKP